MKIIDLRSDTVTKPCDAMRNAMAAAEVGDDVYGEDPAVNRLEGIAARITGAEAALFAPSGTQSNLLALLAHCERGDEYIVGQQAHTYRYEGGGAAVLGSIQPQPLDFEADGSLSLEKVEGLIKPDDFHFAKTRVLCLENTQGGKVLDLDYLGEARKFTLKKGLALHLDGARVFNAAVALGKEAREITENFDSVSICLSKGLGAPVGSLLCGSGALIGRARRWRKVLGGGMRQAGILAAAGIHALENNVARLSEDHENALALRDGLSGIEGIRVESGSAETNMVFISMQEETAGALEQYLHERGILISSGKTVRLVTHLGVTREDMDRVVQCVKGFLDKDEK